MRQSEGVERWTSVHCPEGKWTRCPLSERVADTMSAVLRGSGRDVRCPEERWTECPLSKRRVDDMSFVLNFTGQVRTCPLSQ